ncbi:MULTISPECIES: hypothetical protein [Microbacterium]|uniref:Secreted protein n=1 Tax=Microbacterium wangchenii TaxID=2541726 RepID=A0ABX5SQS7_9MICO|nr:MULTISPECIES: hypothetical protein [Microbacterium]MCK6065032.1 hypothetical protein [Microbacterium sp. EYE_512]QBR88501.1 hypothetical protein E4K62_07260 [Microbacterium wangchenii]TXK20228.1 hypothetical protein FVP99_00875 [Microbacterium wangchenii]
MRLWMSVAAVLAVALLVAVFIGGAVDSSPAQLVAAGIGFAAVMTGWSTGYAVITSKLRPDQGVSASS